MEVLMPFTTPVLGSGRVLKFIGYSLEGRVIRQDPFTEVYYESDKEGLESPKPVWETRLAVSSIDSWVNPRTGEPNPVPEDYGHKYVVLKSPAPALQYSGRRVRRAVPA